MKRAVEVWKQYPLVCHWLKGSKSVLWRTTCSVCGKTCCGCVQCYTVDILGACNVNWDCNAEAVWVFSQRYIFVCWTTPYLMGLKNKLIKVCKLLGIKISRDVLDV